MNIPFYRFVRYEDDGHYIFQCLNCGKNIDVGYGYHTFDPKYCYKCGVEYKGIILPKKIDYISCNPPQEVIFFQIEEACDWGDGSTLDWNKNGMGHENPKQAIEYLKLKKEESERQKSGLNITWKFRIVAERKKKYHDCTPVDMDNYYKKTGRKFNKSENILCQ